MFEPTKEQVEAIEGYLSGESLRIEALAGTGKTTTLRMLVDYGSPRKGKILYTSFGKKVIEDAKKSFPLNKCKVSTNHALAWGVGVRYNKESRLYARLSPQDLIRHLGWSDSTFSPYADVRSGAYGVIETLAAFCQSSAPAMNLGHAYGSAARLARGQDAVEASIAKMLASRAAEAWEEMVRRDAKVPVTHDVYLKQWALGNPRINATTILLDEAQDANGVMVGVLQQQQQAQLIIVGDRRQAIYGFRGAVDAMDMFDIRHSTNLTQSFRFGPEIASVANAILQDQCESSVMLHGDPSQPGHVSNCPEPKCFLARTNATLIGLLFDIADRRPGSRVGVVGGVADLVKLVEGAGNLLIGQPAHHPELAEFSHWQQVKEAIEHEAYGHLRTLVQLVETFGPPPLLDQLEQIRGNEAMPDACDTLLSTAHKAKGSEYSSVKLMDDFKPKGPKENPKLFGWTPEEGNLLYVAATRARQHLDVSNCEAVIGSLPVDFTWTQSPTEVEVSEDVFDQAGDDMGFSFDDLLTPARLLEGDWDHPLIAGGTITVRDEDDGVSASVAAAGHVLFHTEGVLEVVSTGASYVTVRIGSGTLQFPHAAVIQPG